MTYLMNNDDIINSLCSESGIDRDAASKMVGALPDVVKGFCKDLDAVAIPGFGTIAAVKTDERIVTDNVTNETVMLPPEIQVEFKSSVVLRKRFVG